MTSPIKNTMPTSDRSHGDDTILLILIILTGVSASWGYHDNAEFTLLPWAFMYVNLLVTSTQKDLACSEYFPSSSSSSQERTRA